MAGLEISGINASALTEYAMQESKNASAELVKNKAQNAAVHSDKDELWEACKSFEAYFLEQMFKEMQKSVDAWKPEASDNSTSTLVDYFKGETLQDLCASSVETQSNGFAQMLYENMKRTYNIPDAPASEETSSSPAKEI
jgi:flagellar protein FlgJ